MDTFFITKTFLGLADRFFIMDKQKNILFNSKRKGNLLHKEYTLYDTTKNKCARIYKEIDTNYVSYHIEVNEKKIATITTNKGFTTKEFTIEPQGLEIKHNKSKLVFNVVQNNQTIGMITTKLFRFKNTYLIQFERTNDELIYIMIGLTMLIDERDPSFIGSLFKKLDWLA